jgi:FdhD protein
MRITKIDVSSRKAKQATDWVAEERPFFVFLNQKHFVTLMCSPSNQKELTVGHLLSEGLIKTPKEIERTSLTEDTCRIKLTASVDLKKRLSLSGRGSRVILSACGSPSPHQYQPRIRKVRSDLAVEAKTVSDCVNRLNTLAETFRRTGGVHVAAIFKGDGTLVAFAEDVGRHNAVDKAIGGASLADARLSECFLALSGRMTDDIVRKAARTAIPVVASLAAAVDSGITTAQKAGLTLVGFVRGNRMNVYTSPERILA